MQDINEFYENFNKFVFLFFYSVFVGDRGMKTRNINETLIKKMVSTNLNSLVKSILNYTYLLIVWEKAVGEDVVYHI